MEKNARKNGRRPLSLQFLPLCLLSISLCFSSFVSVSVSAEREFDYFMLALQWPGTICARTYHCCSSNGCCQSDPLTWFTIHGLWTDYDDGTWPSCCSHSSFDINKISSLMPELEKYWPSLYCSSSSRCFGGKGPIWAHEWEKHGTCSYPIIQDEYSYFSTTLDLYAKYNVTKMLENAGIEAETGEVYALEEIVSAIKDQFGASPVLVCSKGLIEELRLCFYKDFSPRECASKSSISMTKDVLTSSSSCPNYISLPTYKPLVLGDISGHTVKSV